MTPDTREMLELAAKAGGYEVHRGPASAGQDFMLFIAVDNPDGKVCAREWNPLNDDGDAFRLAVRLQMKVYPGEAYPWCKSSADYKLGAVCDESEESDPYAATRRAIVRAAAEEPVGEVFTMEPLFEHGTVKHHALIRRAVPAGTKLYTADQVAAAVLREREECAAECDRGSEVMTHVFKREGAARCAQAIRARTEKGAAC